MRLREAAAFLLDAERLAVDREDKALPPISPRPSSMFTVVTRARNEKLGRGFTIGSGFGRSFTEGRLRMNTLIGALITFVVIILVLYLVNILPIDGRAKQIVQIIVILIGIISLLKYLAVF